MKASAREAAGRTRGAGSCRSMPGGALVASALAFLASLSFSGMALAQSTTTLQGRVVVSNGNPVGVEGAQVVGPGAEGTSGIFPPRIPPFIYWTSSSLTGPAWHVELPATSVPTELEWGGRVAPGPGGLMVVAERQCTRNFVTWFCTNGPPIARVFGIKIE